MKHTTDLTFTAFTAFCAGVFIGQGPPIFPALSALFLAATYVWASNRENRADS